MPDEAAPPPLSPPPALQPPAAPVPPPPGPTESEIRMWNMWCHLSALSGAIGVPFGNILGPILVWQIKKDQIPSVIEHGKAALNFQITVLIVVLGGALLSLPLMFICIGYLTFLAVMALGVCGMVFTVIAGIKANEGKPYKYPYSFTFVT